MAPLWTIRLLGQLSAKRHEHEITRFQTRQTGALLAYLAFHRHRPHLREALAALLWPDDPPEVSLRKLRVALSSLRRQLEPPGVVPGTVVVATRFEAQLSPAGVATDVAAFEAGSRAATSGRSSARWQHLEEAAQLYGGELLPGSLDEWVLPERHRLENSFLQVIGELIQHLEAAKELARAVHWARRRAAIDPLDEEWHRELIRLHLEAGQPAAAFRQYQELERMLEQELGAVPAAATRELLAAARRLPATRTDPAPHTATEEGPRHVRASLAATMTLMVSEIRPDPAPRPGPDPEDALGHPARLDGLRELCLRHGGKLIEQRGSMLVTAFERGADALAAAVAAHQTSRTDPNTAPNSELPDSAGRPLLESKVPSPSHQDALSFRMALHTGDMERPTEGGSGAALQHALRLVRAAHDGQFLLSEAAAAVLRPHLPTDRCFVDLGAYRLAAAASPERIFQLADLPLDRTAFPGPLAQPAFPHRLPGPLSRFFGREEELQQLRDWLAGGERRLVTLTGPGGSGKSRLALEVVRRLQERWNAAVWFLPLADLTDPRLLPAAILDALDLPGSPYAEPLAQLADALSQQPSLLVLDNFEQLLPGGASWIRSLLEGVPSLTAVVTSRQRLEIEGEYEFLVAPLPTPVTQSGQVLAPKSGMTAATSLTMDRQELHALAQCPSVQLFVDRAQAVEPHFQLVPKNARAVAELCQRLEGLPLALELAAARASAMGPARMLAGLNTGFEFLVSRQRDVTPRHRSLWAALDWSYQLLPPEMQRFFVRLSIFRGGWDGAAAESVCEEPRAPDYLRQLRACSLVQTGFGGEEPRYRMLETLREFGQQQLSPEELRDLARRHCAYYLGMAREAEHRAQEQVRGAWVAWSTVEHANLRAALAWAEANGEGELGLQLAAALFWHWWAYGDMAEGRRCLSTFLELAPASTDPLTRMNALKAGAGLAHRQSDFPAAKALCTAALAISRESGSPSDTATLSLFLGDLARDEGDLDRARTLYEDGIGWHRVSGDRKGVAAGLRCLAKWHRQQAQYDDASALYQEILAIGQELGDREIEAQALSHSGCVARLQGDYPKAHHLQEESLALRQEIGNPAPIADSLLQLARSAQAAGDPQRARDLYAESLAIYRTLEDRPYVALTLGELGELAAQQRRPVEARSAWQESLSIYEDLGHPGGAAHLRRCLQSLPPGGA